jgi:hypothetical protein
MVWIGEELNRNGQENGSDLVGSSTIFSFLLKSTAPKLWKEMDGSKQAYRELDSNPTSGSVSSAERRGGEREGERET